MTQRKKSDQSPPGEENRSDRVGERARPGTITVLMIDAHPWTREALSQAFENAAPDLRVLRFADAEEAVSLKAVPAPALALINGTGRSLSDAWLVRATEIVRSHPGNLPVAVLSEGAEGEEILRAVDAGLSGYIPLSLDLRLAAEAVRFVAAGGTYVPAEPLLASFSEKIGQDSLSGHSISDVLTEAGADGTLTSLLATLTPRERAVLKPLCKGRSNKQIAREVGMSEATVKVHVRHIMRKLGVSNRTQVALLIDLMPKQEE